LRPGEVHEEGTYAFQGRHMALSRISKYCPMPNLASFLSLSRHPTMYFNAVYL